jgi:hypothetical protein
MFVSRLPRGQFMRAWLAGPVSEKRATHEKRATELTRGELVASVFQLSNGQVTLATCDGKRIELEDCSSVTVARRSVDARWHNLDWQEVMPGEWLAWEAS